MTGTYSTYKFRSSKLLVLAHSVYRGGLVPIPQICSAPPSSRLQLIVCRGWLVPIPQICSAPPSSRLQLIVCRGWLAPIPQICSAPPSSRLQLIVCRGWLVPIPQICSAPQSSRLQLIEYRGWLISHAESAVWKLARPRGKQEQVFSSGRTTWNIINRFRKSRSLVKKKLVTL